MGSKVFCPISVQYVGADDGEHLRTISGGLASDFDALGRGAVAGLPAVPIGAARSIAHEGQKGRRRRARRSPTSRKGARIDRCACFSWSSSRHKIASHVESRPTSPAALHRPFEGARRGGRLDLLPSLRPFRRRRLRSAGPAR